MDEALGAGYSVRAMAGTGRPSVFEQTLNDDTVRQRIKLGEATDELLDAAARAVAGMPRLRTDLAQLPDGRQLRVRRYLGWRCPWYQGDATSTTRALS